MGFLIALNEHQPKVKESVMMFSNSTRRAATSVTGALLIALGAAAFAANPPASAGPTPTKAMREKMAVLHEQMAACLRSDKSLSDCRAEMQKSCHDMMGNQGCNMMGMGGRKGMGQGMPGHMMSNPPSSSSPPK